MYNYQILQEVKESLYDYNEDQIAHDIKNYLFALNYEPGTTAVCTYTGDKLEIMVREKEIGATDLFADLQKRYVFSLKKKVLEPLLKNANFRRALKDYQGEDFHTYDKKVREDVTFLINNLTERFGYNEQSARDVCIYVVDNELAEVFED